MGGADHPTASGRQRNGSNPVCRADLSFSFRWGKGGTGWTWAKLSGHQQGGGEVFLLYNGHAMEE